MGRIGMGGVCGRGAEIPSTRHWAEHFGLRTGERTAGLKSLQVPGGTLLAQIGGNFWCLVTKSRRGEKRYVFIPEIFWAF